MTRILLAILSLPLAFVVGCGDPDNCSTGDECNDNVDCGTDCGDDDDTATPGDFSATLRSVAPYGWAGNHRIEMIEPEEENIGTCEDTNSCDASLLEVGNFRLAISGDTFTCVPQVQLVDVNDDGNTVAVSDAWLDEGTCGLAPEGEDAGWNVDTRITDLGNGDQVVITIDNYDAVVTEDTFFYEDDEYLLEGWIAEDLSEVYFHRVLETGETERTLDLNTED